MFEYFKNETVRVRQALNFEYGSLIGITRDNYIIDDDPTTFFVADISENRFNKKLITRLNEINVEDVLYTAVNSDEYLSHLFGNVMMIFPVEDGLRYHTFHGKGYEGIHDPNFLDMVRICREYTQAGMTPEDAITMSLM